MKIFISHQKSDTLLASRIGQRLSWFHDIPYYLDVIDPHLNKPGDTLASYLRREISKCTHLIAVTSGSTKFSQWVPWEIGIATEKEYPLATYADYPGSVPEFLEAWPYLRSLEDVDDYAAAAKGNNYRETLSKSASLTEEKRKEFSGFYNSLRLKLGQPIMQARR